jgi:lysophospholipase L1-like esterase
MKKLYLFLLIAWWALPAIAQQNNEQWARLSRYAQDNAARKNNPGEPLKAVFIGNSITQGWADVHPDFFTTRHYAGRGISGQTTPQFLSRFRADVIDLHPQAVVINGGVNDIAENTGTYAPDYTFGSIQSMAELAQANNIKVILTSVLPAAQIPWRKEITDTPAKIAALNARIKAYAEAKGFVYVDYYSRMVAADKGLMAEYTTDGVHVTAAGYRVMEAIIEEAINNTVGAVAK